jgi:hypothetical protein
VDIQAAKAALDSALVTLRQKYDKHLGIIDFFNIILSSEESVDLAARTLAANQALGGRLSLFKPTIYFSLDLLLEFVKALGALMQDQPSRGWDEGTTADKVSAAFSRFSQCHNTSRVVLTKLIGARLAGEANRVLDDGTATSGRLDASVPFKRGVLTGQNIGTLTVPSGDAVLLMSAADHIFVLASTAQKWRLYQSFRNKYLLALPGFGNVAVDDLKSFLTDITGSKATDWFGGNPGSGSFKYVMMG